MDFSLKKEGHFDTHYNMDESWRYYAKWKKAGHERINFTWFHLHYVPRVVEFIEHKIEQRLPGAGKSGDLGISA